jgi:Fic-DOC domain mobile mystery protein B
VFPVILGETPIDPSGLLDRTSRTRGRLNIVEAENIRKATVKYLAKRPTKRQAQFDYAWGLKLHREMFGEVWEWAGTLRTVEVTIGIPPEHVETSLYGLFQDLPVWAPSGALLLDQAVRLHHQAVRIHPFLNGNGRWARMLANIWLRLHYHPITIWPEENIGRRSAVRDEYIAAIQAADNGDDGPLFELHRRYTA